MLPLIPPRRRLAPLLSHPLPFLSTHTQNHRPFLLPPPRTQTRLRTKSSWWLERNASDHFTSAARLKGLKSRAAWKLLEIDDLHHVFRPDQCVIDLGFAPGSWTQVAVERTRPRGRVLGIDLLPAAPPKGASAIQGNILSEATRELVRGWVVEVEGRRRREMVRGGRAVAAEKGSVEGEEAGSGEGEEGPEMVEDRPSYIDMERSAAKEMSEVEAAMSASEEGGDGGGAKAVGKEMTEKEKEQRLKSVDLVLSDMSAPWPQTHGFSVNSLSNPYRRLMNTSGNKVFDHAGSMRLCQAALNFAGETLKTGGHFVCKFYSGDQDKELERRLKKMFKSVHRFKPKASRDESRECYFVAKKRLPSRTISNTEDGLETLVNGTNPV